MYERRKQNFCGQETEFAIQRHWCHRTKGRTRLQT